MRQDGRNSDTDGVFVLRLSGELDLATAPRAADQGAAALELDGMRLLVVDLAAVTFIDSTAIRTLVELRARAEDAGVELRLRGVPARVGRVLQITGLDQVFVIEAD
jgi:anti-sigma B factor antagonist